jgi:para-aminobenzoate synthetase / 4-amino-4-deoxychorismate lyase
MLEHSAPPHADAAAGVFETLLVTGGEAVGLRRHLARLREAAAVLYGAILPDELETAVAREAGGHALGRLRITVMPGEAITIDCDPLDPSIVLPADEVQLVAVRVAGGPGRHKLADRDWLEGIEAAAGAHPLLVSRDGALLETTRANVFLLAGGALATPPLDGSILPGVTRAVAIAAARTLGIAVAERRLTFEDLAAADAVLLSGSLRLLERARVRAGEELTERLARAIDPRGDGATVWR